MIACSTLDVVMGDYLQNHSPVTASIEGRIVKVDTPQQQILGSRSTTIGSTNGGVSQDASRLITGALVAVSGLILVAL
jgi:hypothetical protein